MDQYFPFIAVMLVPFIALLCDFYIKVWKYYIIEALQPNKAFKREIHNGGTMKTQ